MRYRYLSLAKNMGLSYIGFRIWHEIARKSHILQLFYPDTCATHQFISLEQWRTHYKPFFFPKKNKNSTFLLSSKAKQELANNFGKIISGNIQFFNGAWHTINKPIDWLHNFKSDYRYTAITHWTRIQDIDINQGDIKVVWELSRFCFMYTIMRNDFHSGENHSDYVFDTIEDWIDTNRINRGPNYKCSQEISLRILNWIFLLYFYKDSIKLAEPIFSKLLNSIYQQTKHVYKNYRFSQISVRNNHIITEAACLYTVGTLFPWFPESVQWKEKGKKILECEGLHQIYIDGAYIQHSHNYHRVVIQLYTWCLFLARLNKDTFSRNLEERLLQSLLFLYQMQDQATGNLPNYGANDGSLFFPLNSCDFRDFRPQLNALYFYFFKTHLYPDPLTHEDVFWFSDSDDSGITPATSISDISRNHFSLKQTTKSFPQGGYHVIRGDNWYFHIRCAKFTHRPSHADNLHLDIWYFGKNIIRDCGSFCYNDTDNTSKFFFGSSSHNTVMLDDFDQMEKGPRFIWFNWSNSIDDSIKENQDSTLFSGTIQAFSHVGKNILHHRKVRQLKNLPRWEIEDSISGWCGNVKQIWNLSPDFFTLDFTIRSFDSSGNPIKAIHEKGWYSPTYGICEESSRIVFITQPGHFFTIIEKK